MGINKKLFDVIEKLSRMQIEYSRLDLHLQSLKDNPGVFALVDYESTEQPFGKQFILLVQNHLPFNRRDVMNEYIKNVHQEMSILERDIKIILNTPVSIVDNQELEKTDSKPV